MFYNDKFQFGRQMENLAVNHCHKLGWQVLVRNWRRRGGELDLICFDQQQVIIIEVKGRQSSSFGQATEQFNNRQLRRVWFTAQKYLLNKGLVNFPWRIDFMAIQKEKNQWRLRHYPAIDTSCLQNIH